MPGHGQAERDGLRRVPDADAGEDALVYRCGPAGIRLARQRSMCLPQPPVGHPMTVNPRHTPRLTTMEATRQVALGWLPFLFFTETTAGRGNLLYRRHDGDLGLITPAGRPEAGAPTGSTFHR